MKMKSKQEVYKAPPFDESQETKRQRLKRLGLGGNIFTETSSSYVEEYYQNHPVLLPSALMVKHPSFQRLYIASGRRYSI